MAAQLQKKIELFDLSKLPQKDQDRYGTHDLGRHLLLARRLLEAGVTFVKVTSYGWDTHGDHFNRRRASTRSSTSRSRRSSKTSPTAACSTTCW